ncbi:hypothetical protein GMMP15_570021 [Candidatus Magnetomoraceae bacterium gMMP-15]
MNELECPKCKQWYLKEDDNYCGFCGQLLIDIDLKPRDVILTSPNVPRQKITFINTGHRKCNIKLQSTNPLPGFINFKPSNLKFFIPKNSKFELEVLLDQKKLPSNFIEEDLASFIYQFTLFGL